MVRVLIGLRATIARNQMARGSAAALWAAVAFGLLSAAGTLSLGIVGGGSAGGRLDGISAVLALWFFGQLAQSALNGGDSSLRPELLAPLPLGRRRLALALLAVGLCDPVLVIIAIAYAAVVAAAAGLGAAALIAAIAGTAALLAATSVAATVAGGTLGPGSRRGRDLGTIVVALAISVLALAATLLPALLSGLRSGRWPVVTAVVRALPSGWPGDAVTAARDGRWLLAVAAAGAPLVLAALIAAAWPGILARRMSVSAATSRGGRPGAIQRLLPATPAGAVAAKEIRLWLRDPVRVTCLLIAVIVGVGTGLVPRLAGGTTHLLPFSGVLTVIIAGACATNLYGNDGSSLWLTVMTPRAAAADVRGRQLGWVLLVAPLTVAETVILTVWSGQGALWPWALGLLVALLGGAAGLLPLASLVSVQPLDDGGNPTPAWSLKVHVALIAVALTAAPTIGLLILGGLDHSGVVSWLGVAVGAVTAAACTAAGGAAAARRLSARQTVVLWRLRAAS